LQSGKKLTSLIHFKCISKYIKKNWHTGNLWPNIQIACVCVCVRVPSCLHMCMYVWMWAYAERGQTTSNFTCRKKSRYCSLVLRWKMLAPHPSFSVTEPFLPERNRAKSPLFLPALVLVLGLASTGPEPWAGGGGCPSLNCFTRLRWDLPL
jgi:hypothetical protein